MVFLQEDFMNDGGCRRAASVHFWDGYAKWYQLWMEHNRCHDRIVEAVTSMAEPGWRVLDIGAGSIILSFPLSQIGCSVTALEPSIGMRNLFYEEAFKRRIDWISVDDRSWEKISSTDLENFDLIMVCNTHHLTELGFVSFIEKIFRANPRNVFVAAELGLQEIKVKRHYDNYSMLFEKYYGTQSSFAYHHLDEVVEHHAFKKGHRLDSREIGDVISHVTIATDHFWIRDSVTVGMYWWRRLAESKAWAQNGISDLAG